MAIIEEYDAPKPQDTARVRFPGQYAAQMRFAAIGDLSASQVAQTIYERQPLLITVLEDAAGRYVPYGKCKLSDGIKAAMARLRREARAKINGPAPMKAKSTWKKVSVVGVQCHNVGDEAVIHFGGEIEAFRANPDGSDDGYVDFPQWNEWWKVIANQTRVKRWVEARKASRSSTGKKIEKAQQLVTELAEEAVELQDDVLAKTDHLLNATAERLARLERWKR